MAGEYAMDFQAMFGGATADGDYPGGPGADGSFLPTPQAGDDLETTARKLRALALVVEQGKSLAVATGYRQAAHPERDPEALARMEMPPIQVMQLDAWQAGAKMPDIEWSKSTKAVPSGARSGLRFARAARAMEEIWQVEGLDGENASWLTSNMVYALPLVTAVMEIQSAKRHDVNQMQLAEVQTAHKIVVTTTKIMNDMYRRLDILRRDINQAKDIIQAREHALKGKMSGYKTNQDRFTEQGDAMDLSVIRAYLDLGDSTKGKRMDRTNLLSGTDTQSKRRANSLQRDTTQKRARV